MAMPIETFSRRQFLRQSGLLSGLSLIGSSDGRTRIRRRQPQVDTGGHPMFCVDAANTGHNPDERGPSAPIDQQWRFGTEDEVASSPAVVDGTAYVGSHDGNVYAISTDDGSERWRFQTGAGVASSPAVVDGTVYVGSGTVGNERGTVFALDAATGSRRWGVQTDGFVLSSPTVVDGTVYVGDGDGTVHALSTADGSTQWRVQTGNLSGVNTSPAVVDGTVYVGSFNSRVYALSAADGTERWRFRAESGIASSPAVVDGTVYVGDNSLDAGLVYALSAADGTERWRFQTVGGVAASPAVVGDTVYVGSSKGFIYALSVADGTEQWRFRTDGVVVSSPAVVDGSVYVGSHDGSVYALSTADGTEQWRVRTGDSVESSPAVVDSTVYVGSHDGSVYALTEGELDPQITGPDTAAVGEPVTFEGSVSTATEESAYEWAFGSDPTVTATGKQVTHTFTEQGEYTVRLRVSTGGTQQTTTTTLRAIDPTTPVPRGTETATPTITDYTTEPPRTQPPNTGVEEQYGPDSSGPDSSGPDSGGTGAVQTATPGATVSDSLTPTVLSGVIVVSSTIAGLAAWNHVRNGADPDDGKSEEAGESSTATAETESPDSPAGDEDGDGDGPDTDGGEPDDGDGGAVADDGGESTDTADESAEDAAEDSGTVTDDQPSAPTDEYEPPPPGTPAGTFLRSCDRVDRIRPVDTAGPVHVYGGRYTDGEGTERACVYALSPAHAETVAAVEAFETAAHEWEGISKNTHVATVYDSGDEPRPWVAFDPGIGQLGNVLSSLERDGRVDAIGHLAKAVRTASMYNLVHGNISPSVAFIGEDLSATPVVTLADWGIQRAVAREVDAASMTPYTAPEQLTGDSAGTATDVYRLGAVAYRVLTGRPPFVDAEDPRRAIRDGELTPPTAREPSLPEEVDKIIGDAMAPVPSERIQPYDFRQRLIAAIND